MSRTPCTSRNPVWLRPKNWAGQSNPAFASSFAKPRAKAETARPTKYCLTTAARDFPPRASLRKSGAISIGHRMPGIENSLASLITICRTPGSRCTCLCPSRWVWSNAGFKYLRDLLFKLRFYFQETNLPCRDRPQQATRT